MPLSLGCLVRLKSQVYGGCDVGGRGGGVYYFVGRSLSSLWFLGVITTLSGKWIGCIWDFYLENALVLKYSIQSYPLPTVSDL